MCNYLLFSFAVRLIEDSGVGRVGSLRGVCRRAIARVARRTNDSKRFNFIDVLLFFEWLAITFFFSARHIERISYLFFLLLQRCVHKNSRR